MSVIGIFRQLTSNASCESLSVIDLPDLPVEKLPTTRQGRFKRVVLSAPFPIS